MPPSTLTGRPASSLFGASYIPSIPSGTSGLHDGPLESTGAASAPTLSVVGTLHAALSPTQTTRAPLAIDTGNPTVRISRWRATCCYVFTGLIELVGTLASRAPRGGGARLRFQAAFAAPLAVGESISVSGVCLTVDVITKDGFEADASLETLSVTTLGALAPKARVNLEHAVTLEKRLGGHIVSGHVDGVGQLVSREAMGDAEKLVFRAPSGLMRFVAPKGFDLRRWHQPHRQRRERGHLRRGHHPPNDERDDHRRRAPRRLSEPRSRPHRAVRFAGHGGRNTCHERCGLARVAKAQRVHVNYTTRMAAITLDPKLLERVNGAIADIRAGKMVILVDDEDRENEGDLCMSAEFVTAESINFMATHGRGLICVALTEEQIERLGLPMMQSPGRGGPPLGTAFTVSVEARHGVTTGISASDSRLHDAPRREPRLPA